MRSIFKKIFIFLFLFLIFFSSINNIYAYAQPPAPEEEIVRGTVIKILKENKITFSDVKSIVQVIEIKIDTGNHRGRIVNVSTSAVPVNLERKFKKGDKLILGYQGTAGEYFYVIDHDRTLPLTGLFILFIALTIFVVRKKGIKSLLSMLLSFCGIFLVTLPLISNGFNPIIVSLGSVVFLVPTIFLFTHGFNKKTYTATLGSILSIIITFLITLVMIDLSSITGLFIEDLELLVITSESGINVSAILIASIVIGAMGALDDVTITQAATVEQLADVSKKIGRKDLYNRAMTIGRDHLASIINTLILVYTGAALPLFLLFYEFKRPLLVNLTSEAVSFAIITALTVTIGLIISVPLTTYIAVRFLDKKNVDDSKKRRTLDNLF